MWRIDPQIAGLAAAIGIGLLVGIERERSKGRGPGRKPGGVRTFTLAALLGAVAGILGNDWITAGVLTGMVAFGVAAYVRSSSHDPGLTTEVALFVTTLLGYLAAAQPGLAAAIGVIVTIVLASRTQLHRFVRDRLSEQEVNDGLLLAAAALVVLPLLPDEAIDPFGVFNPRVIWALAVLVMGINAIGYVALRTLGPTAGLPLSGLVGGFVSSTATHAAMASRARGEPALTRAAVAGALLSTVATPIFMEIVLAVANRQLMRAMAVPMLAAGIAAASYGAFFVFDVVRSPPPHDMRLGRAFQPRTAVYFTLTVSAVMFVAALMSHFLGTAGAVLGVAFAGFADTQAAGASAASLATSGGLSISGATLATMLAFTANALMKVAVSYVSGGLRYGSRVLAGQVLVVASAWAGWTYGEPLAW